MGQGNTNALEHSLLPLHSSLSPFSHFGIKGGPNLGHLQLCLKTQLFYTSYQNPRYVNLFCLLWWDYLMSVFVVVGLFDE
jgi:hypothetical protein